MISAAICGAMFFMGLQIGGLQLMVFRIAKSFSLNTEQTSLLISAQYVCMIVVPLGVGILSDRMSKRRVLIMAQIVYCLGCVGACQASAYTALAGAILLIGAGYSAAQAISCAALADMYGTKSLKYQNLSQCLFSLAAFLSPLLLQRLELPWERVFQTAGAGVLLCTAVLFGGGNEAWGARTGSDDGFTWSRERTLWKQLSLLMLCMMLCVGLENGITYFSSPLVAQKNWDEAYAAYTLSAFWIMVTVARLIYSRLSIAPLKAVSRMELCLGLILLLICHTGRPVVAVLMFGLAGGCIAILGPSLISQATAICPSCTGVASSLMISASGVGSVIMPILMGAMADQLSMELSYLTIAVIALFGGLLALYLRRTTQHTSAGI